MQPSFPPPPVAALPFRVVLGQQLLGIGHVWHSHLRRRRPLQQQQHGPRVIVGVCGGADREPAGVHDRRGSERDGGD
jgi:hypothetical protein